MLQRINVFPLDELLYDQGEIKDGAHFSLEGKIYKISDAEKFTTYYKDHNEIYLINSLKGGTHLDFGVEFVSTLSYRLTHSTENITENSQEGWLSLPTLLRMSRQYGETLGLSHNRRLTIGNVMYHIVDIERFKAYLNSYRDPNIDGIEADFLSKREQNNLEQIGVNEIGIVEEILSSDDERSDQLKRSTDGQSESESYQGSSTSLKSSGSYDEPFIEDVRPISEIYRDFLTLNTFKEIKIVLSQQGAENCESKNVLIVPQLKYTIGAETYNVGEIKEFTAFLCRLKALECDEAEASILDAHKKFFDKKLDTQVPVDAAEEVLSSTAQPSSSTSADVTVPPQVAREMLGSAQQKSGLAK